MLHIIMSNELPRGGDHRRGVQPLDNQFQENASPGIILIIIISIIIISSSSMLQILYCVIAVYSSLCIYIYIYTCIMNILSTMVAAHRQTRLGSCNLHDQVPLLLRWQCCVHMVVAARLCGSNDSGSLCIFRRQC